MMFRSIMLRGFRSFRGRCELTIPDDGGLIYITGENKVEPSLGANGVGKSTLFDALHWAFYGKTSRNLRASEAANWSATDDGCEVTVQFDDHTVRRTWNPNSLTLDDTVVEQPKLEDTIGMNEDAFLSAIYHAQFVPHFADRGPTAQLEIFSDALRLDVWERAAANAAETVRECERDLASHQQRLGLSRGAHAEARARLDELESKELTWWREHVDKMRIAQVELRKLQAKLDDAVRVLEVESKDRRDDDDDGEFDAQHAKLDKMKADRSVAEHKCKDAEDRITALKEGSKCPMCMEPIDYEKVHAFWSRIARGASIDVRKLTREVRMLDAQIKEMEQQRKQKIQAAAKHHGQLKERIELLRSAITDSRRNLRELADAKCPHDSESLAERVGALAVALEQARASERNTRARISAHAYWIKAFRDIRLELVDTALAQFELTTNNVLTQLGLGDWRIEYDVQSETKKGTIHSAFTINVLSPYNTKPVPFHAWSGGESQRLRLAVTLGLSDVIQDFTGSQSNLEIFDEPTAWLSTEGISSLLDMLVTRARDNERTILLADHRVIESTVFSGHLNVIKDERGSRIVDN